MTCRWLSVIPLLALLVSCGPKNSLEKTYTLPTQNAASSAPAQAPAPAVAIPVSREKPAEELLTKEIDIHEVVEKYFTENLSGKGSLEEVTADIGVECLRETEAGALYSVHEIKQGGRLYIFYTNDAEAPDYHAFVQWFYVQKKRSRADFAAIKIGSAIEEVKKIDPTTQIFENIYNANPAYWSEQKGYMSWHYLDDGILEIGYEIGSGKVMALNFTDNYQISRYDANRVLPYDGRILEMDWVD